MTHQGILARFRTPARDLRSDNLRIEAVRAAVGSAISSIDFELTGLKKKIESARAWTACVMGTEDGSYFDREAAVEKDLLDAEKSLRAGIERLSKLRELRRRFVTIQDLLDD